MAFDSTRGKLLIVSRGVQYPSTVIMEILETRWCNKEGYASKVVVFVSHL